MGMQWIKLYASMFSNRKIQLLLSRRDGDTFFRVWIQLLTLAGQSVDNGKIMRSETVPMSVEELAKIMHKNADKMKSILDILIHLEMIKYEDNTYIIKNWNEYQSADKYEKIAVNDKIRMYKKWNIKMYNFVHYYIRFPSQTLVEFYLLIDMNFH